jgi:hypothetical protein
LSDGLEEHTCMESSATASLNADMFSMQLLFSLVACFPRQQNYQEKPCQADGRHSATETVLFTTGKEKFNRKRVSLSVRSHHFCNASDVQATAMKNVHERGSRLEYLCWRIWHMTRLKKKVCMHSHSLSLLPQIL